MDWNFADLFEAVADTVPDNDRDHLRRPPLTYAELDERVDRLAHHLLGAGVAAGDHVGIYAYNGIEWVEAMFGIYKVRAVPINVNYRYVEAELATSSTTPTSSRSCTGASSSRASTRCAPTLPKLKALRLDRGRLRRGPRRRSARSSTRPRSRRRRPSACPARAAADDLYILYTGGTTGMPKGVMWRQEDFFHSTIGALMAGGGTFESPEAVDRGREERRHDRRLPDRAAHARRRAVVDARCCCSRATRSC